MGRRQFLALLRKDLLIELRTREMLLSMFLFAVLVLVVFHYAFDPKGGADLTPLAGGMLWVVFLFAALLGLNRSFAREKDEGHRCDIEAGMAKLLAARVAWANADNALQVHGGNGYAEEYPISRILCDARILNIFEGAAEIQAQVIARGLLSGARN